MIRVLITAKSLINVEISLLPIQLCIPYVKCQLHYDRNGATIVYVMTPDSVADCGSSGAISTAATGGMKMY